MKTLFSFWGLLTVFFIVLKLTGQVDWSWWLVLAPVLWPFYVIFAIVIGAVIIAGVEVLKE